MNVLKHEYIKYTAGSKNYILYNDLDYVRDDKYKLDKYNIIDPIIDKDIDLKEDLFKAKIHIRKIPFIKDNICYIIDYIVESKYILRIEYNYRYNSIYKYYIDLYNPVYELRYESDIDNSIGYSVGVGDIVITNKPFYGYNKFVIIYDSIDMYNSIHNGLDIYANMLLPMKPLKYLKDKYWLLPKPIVLNSDISNVVIPNNDNKELLEWIKETQGSFS